MKIEVRCACEFFSRMLHTRNLPVQFIKPFKRRLEELLVERFKNHWDPEHPNKGSAYRCIRINSRLDPVVKEAAKATGLSDISSYLPAEFTMWIDPSDVSYRFGEDGSICQCSLSNKTSDWDNTSHGSSYSSESSSTSAKQVQAPSSSYLNQVYNISAHLDYAIPVNV